MRSLPKGPPSGNLAAAYSDPSCKCNLKRVAAPENISVFITYRMGMVPRRTAGIQVQVLKTFFLVPKAASVLA
jgi:hypothetical protein